MSRLVAFLRAINVGGRNVKMERIRAIFEELGLKDVETFIQSGNVIFSTRATVHDRLEKRIEGALLDALGYEVATFVRPLGEIAGLLLNPPIPSSRLRKGKALSVGFLKQGLDAQGQQDLASLGSEEDLLVSSGRELWWSSLVKQSESRFNNARMERRLAVSATWRSIESLGKLIDKHGGQAG